MHLKLSFAKTAAILSKGDEFKWVDYDLHFCLSHSYQAQQCKTWGYFFSWNIASSNFFPFQSKCLCSYKYYLSKGGFHPTHHVFKWTNVSLSSKLATSYNCILHKYVHFDHYLVPGTFLIWYGFFCSVLVSVITIVMCMFKFNINDNG